MGSGLDYTDVQECIKAHAFSQSNSDKIKMQEQVLLLLVLLFSQALADMNLNITSPTACTTSDNSNTVETTLYGVSGFLISFVGLIPGGEPFAAGLSALYSVWVRI